PESREPQHVSIAAQTLSTPVTLSTVSCCPAKLAQGRSSAVALDLTATGPPSPSSAYASAISARCNLFSAKAAVVRQKPSGTCSPAAISRPSPVAFPPTRSIDPAVISDRGITFIAHSLRCSSQQFDAAIPVIHSPLRNSC